MIEIMCDIISKNEFETSPPPRIDIGMHGYLYRSAVYLKALYGRHAFLFLGLRFFFFPLHSSFLLGDC
jgi:hypothetical protein